MGAQYETPAGEVNLDDWLEINDDGTRTLRLEYPFAISIKDGNGTREEEVTHLRFRRPKGRDMDILGQRTVPALRSFAVSITVEPVGLSAKHFMDADGADITRIYAATDSFFPRPKPKDGATPPGS